MNTMRATASDTTERKPIKTGRKIKDKDQGIATILAFALLPLSGFATDIYIPSLPTMAVSLHTGNMQVQLTLTLFLVSYGITQLFIGGILDSYGRYRIGLVSLVIFALASLVIAITHNIYLIYLMRIIHGMTVGAIIVGKRAFFVDLFKGDQLKLYLSLFTIIWSTGPIIAPFIGGYLQTAFGWESNFYLLAGLAIVIAILEFAFSGESLPEPTEFHLPRIANIYAGMIRTTPFTLGMVMLGLAYAMVMVYNMTGPFIIEHHLHLSPVTAGYSSLFLGFAWMAGGFIGRATIRYPFFRKLAYNSILQLLFALTMLIVIPHAGSLYTILFFAFIIHVCAGYTFNNFFTFCLSSFPRNAGIASGLTGGTNYMVVSLLSYTTVAFFPARDGRNLSYGYLLLIFCSLLVMALIHRARKGSSSLQQV